MRDRTGRHRSETEMDEDAKMEELDAAALLFLDDPSTEYVDDGLQAHVLGASGAQLPPDDATLLSSLWASPSGSFDGLEIDSLGTVDAAFSLDSTRLLPTELPGQRDDSVSSATIGASTQIASASRPSDVPPTGQSTRKKPKRSANYQPNRARNERRHELIALKRTITELEEEVARLRVNTPDTVAVASRRGTDTEQNHQQIQPSNALSTATASQNTSVWERVAVRQLNERRRAERENERLKERLQTQLKIARTLQRTLQKRAVTQGIEESGLGKQRRVFANASVKSDDLIFEELLHQVHRIYLDADDHFERMGISAAEVSCQDAHRRKNAVEMEVFMNEVLPFELHKVGKAAWQYFSNDKNHLPYRLHYERLRENSNFAEHTIIENTGIEFHASGIKYVFNVKQVLRRYVESDRVVIAYSSIAQPVEFANKLIRGCQFREYGCMALKRPAVHNPKTHSVMQSCYFITPERHGHDGFVEDDRTIQELTDFNVQSTAATMAAWLQMIENILVTDQLGIVQL